MPIAFPIPNPKAGFLFFLQMFDAVSIVKENPDSSGVVTVASGYLNTSQPISSLKSETTYSICLAATDLQEPSNLQPLINRTQFSTLDITPPALQAEILNATIRADRCAGHGTNVYNTRAFPPF